MENNLVQIDPKEYGLEESKAQQIAAQFKPMLDKMVELEKEYNEVIQLPIEDPLTSKKAKELRQKYVKVRTGTAEIHKEQKAFYLAGGRFVDGWKNAQLFASQGIEEKLEAIEKHFENLEKQRKEALRLSRIDQLAPFEVENVHLFDLSNMSDEQFNMVLSGAESAFKAKKEAERLVEEQRLESLRLDKVANERRIEIAPFAQFITVFPDLRNMSDEQYKNLLSELNKADAEFRIEQEKIKAENERLRAEQEKANKERKEAEEKAAKERKEAEDKLRAEQEKLATIERELQLEKQRAESARQAEIQKQADEEKSRLLAEKKAKAAPDKVKLEDFAKQLDTMVFPDVKSEDAQKIIASCKELISKVSTYIRDKNNSL